MTTEEKIKDLFQGGILDSLELERQLFVWRPFWKSLSRNQWFVHVLRTGSSALSTRLSDDRKAHILV
jgi:hypothetical protein